MPTKTEMEPLHQSIRYRETVDAALDRYTQFGAGCPAVLGAAIRYMLLAPGKRIRPLLTMYANDACKGSVDAAVPAACAVEMIHTYSLIHDDLPSMDNDDLRRGQPTCHRRFDEATAILAGDALQTLAFEILARDVHNNAAECILALAQASGPLQLIGGQVDDLTGSIRFSGNGFEQQKHADERPIAAILERLENVHRRKTAALLIVSLKMGGLIANASNDQLVRFGIFGEKLGLAFQIVDDLLDFCGDATKMGKQSGKDQINGTLTYPQLLGVDQSRQRATHLIGQALTALDCFDESADPLRQIAEFVLNRDY